MRFVNSTQAAWKGRRREMVRGCAEIPQRCGGPGPCLGVLRMLEAMELSYSNSNQFVNLAALRTVLTRPRYPNWKWSPQGTTPVFLLPHWADQKGALPLAAQPPQFSPRPFPGELFAPDAARTLRTVSASLAMTTGL